MSAPARRIALGLCRRDPRRSRLLRILAFQAAEIYDIHAFRRPINQMAKLVSAWSVVFLFGTAVTFFGKLGEEFSRVWFASFFGFGLSR